MAIAFNRAREALEKIKRHRNRCLIIHYACQSLYDDRDGLSPCISNIVVKSFANDQTVSFAAHLVAEKLHIPKEEIVKRFDEIERGYSKNSTHLSRRTPATCGYTGTW